MKMMIESEAKQIVENIKDNLDKKVDKSVFQTVVNFTRIGSLLGFKTCSSCEGHLDWGHPFPRVKCEIPLDPPKIRTPVWKFWKHKKYLHEIISRDRYFRDKEIETIKVIRFFENELLGYTSQKELHPFHKFYIERNGPVRFSIVPLFSGNSESLRSNGKIHELQALLINQRQELELFSIWILSRLLDQMSFEGIPETHVLVVTVKVN